MECLDEASSSSESLNLNGNDGKGTIEFIQVKHDEDTQFAEEIDLETPLVQDENYSLEDEKDTMDMLIEAAITKENFVLRLVDSVQKLPILWKKNNRGYRDPSALQEAWNTLSEEFGIPAKYLKEKWKLLRGQFRTNCAKLRHMRASSDNKYYPTWFAFNAMRFLKDIDGTVTEITKTNAPAVGDDNNCIENESTQMEEVDKQSIILELINQIKQKPVLWDRSFPLYNSKDEPTMAWKNIADSMNLPVDDVKLKWKILRAQLRNNLKKIKSQSSAGLPVRPPTWFAFEAMQFVLKNRNTDGVDLDITQEVTQPETETTKPLLPKTVTIKRLVPTTVTSKQHVAAPVAVKQNMPDSLSTVQPLAKAVTIKRIVPKAVQLSSMTKPNIRDFKRRYIGSTMSTLPKVLRTTPDSSSQPSSKPVPSITSPSSSSSRVDPFIMKTFQNLTKITDKMAQTEASPYSGLLNHLTTVLSKKRASDFNQIESLLLNCLSELNKYPNAGNDSILDVPSSIVIDDSDPKEDEREDSNDPYD